MATDEPLPRCAICGHQINSGTLVYTPCRHALDLECLRSLFEQAAHDRSRFPPKCCQAPLPLAAARPHLEPTLISRFEQMANEFRTSNGVYCAGRTCGTFLGPATASASSISCPECAAETCGCCKEPAHPQDRKCTPLTDRNTDVVELALDGYSQHCLSCGRISEFDHRCSHGTYRCGKLACPSCVEMRKHCDEARKRCAATWTQCAETWRRCAETWRQCAKVWEQSRRKFGDDIVDIVDQTTS